MTKKELFDLLKNVNDNTEIYILDEHGSGVINTVQIEYNSRLDWAEQVYLDYEV